MLGGRRKKRLKSLQMRGRKEMKDLDKSALSRICAEIETVLRVGEEESINTIKSQCKGILKRNKHLSWVFVD